MSLPKELQGKLSQIEETLKTYHHRRKELFEALECIKFFCDRTEDYFKNQRNKIAGKVLADIYFKYPEKFQI
jgi:hypothetical protein